MFYDTATQGKWQWTSISTSVKGGHWMLSAPASLALTSYYFPGDLQGTLFPFRTPAKALFVSLPYVFCRKLTLISPWSNVL